MSDGKTYKTKAACDSSWRECGLTWYYTALLRYIPVIILNIYFRLSLLSTRVYQGFQHVFARNQHRTTCERVHAQRPRKFVPTSSGTRRTCLRPVFKSSTASR